MVYRKFIGLFTAIALTLLLVNACSQPSPDPVVVPNINIPATLQPDLDVNKNVNDTITAIQQDEGLVVAALGDNLIINSGFDQGDTGWSSCGGATSYTITDDGVSGDAAKLSTGCFYQTVPASTDMQLSFSCKAKVVEATGWSGMGFGFTNANFETIAEAPSQAITGGDYKGYVTTLTAPADTTYASVWVYTDGTIHIDDCSLIEGAPSAPEGNLLSNASFTSSADWFNCGNANNWTIASGDLNITNTACIYQTNNAQANLDYTLSCNSKRTGDVYTSLILSALDDTYASIAQEVKVIENTSFQNNTISLTTPANTTFISATFYGEGATTYQECSLTAGDNTTPSQQAPTVAITAPSNGITLEVGSTISEVQAEANDSDGSVSNVRLYLNDQLISQDNVAPYRWRNKAPLANLSAGSYTLRAEATDNDGLTATDTISFEVATATSSDESTKGKWSGVQAWPVNASQIANLPDGRILAWTTFDEGDLFHSNANQLDRNYNHAVMFDPTTQTFEEIDHPSHDMFCTGLATLSDGTIVAAGGGFNNTGNRDSVSFFKDFGWETVQDMPSKHWYPTAYADPNDNVLVSLGTSANGKSSYMSNDGSWINMPGVDLAGTVDNSIKNPQYYPSLHTSPRGTVFHSGPTTKMHELTIGSTSTTTTSVGNRNQDGVTGETYRLWANTIMIDEGKILITGGTPTTTGTSSLKTGIMIDINNANPAVEKIAPMKYSRSFHSTLLLPNGEVLVVGGNGTAKTFDDNQSRLVPEIYNPTTDTWREVAAMTIPRNYHSTAILLQDGRILAAGGGVCGCDADHQDGQIYSPPYLFKADGSLANRPVIASAPATLGYNQNFNVTITGAGQNNISRFSMIRLSASTHHVNMDLRQDSLAFTNQGNGNYQVKTHSNKNVVTPGYYFLFASNAAGVPSVAKIVKIGTGPGAPPSTPAVAKVSQVSGVSATTAWGVNSDNQILRTTNGISWSMPNPGPRAKQISAVNANNAWIIGTNDSPYRTTNGGSSWQRPNQDTNAQQISAINANNAWIIGTNNKPFVTTNGGSSWQQKSVSPDAKQISAVSASIAWIIATDDRPYITTDGGATWSAPSAGAKAKQISAIDGNTAWIIGLNDSPFITTNGGANWKRPNNAAIAKQLSAVDNNNAWIIGSNFRIFRSSNGGTSWQVDDSEYN